MDVLLLIIRLGLALLFLIAGFAKLADRAGSRQAMRDFGVADKFADVFGVVLPLAELAVAIALLVPRSAWFAGIGALALLLIFVVGIGYNLAHGRTPDCHCFGQLHSAPAGWSTLIRNVFLALAAGVLVAFARNNAGPGALEFFAHMTMRERFELFGAALLLMLVVGQSRLLVQAMTQQGRLLLRIEAVETRLGIAPSQTGARAVGLPVGSAAPGFELPTLDADTISLEELRQGNKIVFLVFSDANCGPCSALLPEIANWQRDYASKMGVAVISRGTIEANRAKASESGVMNVLLQKDREVAQAYKAFGTPSAVVVRHDGTIASALAQGAEAIRSLIANVVDGKLPMPAPNTKLKIGEAAPDFTLPNLAGEIVRLSDYRGTPTVILFWRPSCGFCAHMLPDLKAWEANAKNGAAKVLVVSSDTVAANEAMGLRSTIVLDNSGLGVGRQFGASGTPMALLVDEHGKIASDLAAGAPAVLALVAKSSSEKAAAK